MPWFRVGAACFLLLRGVSVVADDPKPEALIRGLLDARAAISRGHLEAVLEVVVPRRDQPSPSIRLSMLFDGGDWFLDQSNETHLIEISDDKKMRIAQKRFQATGEDSQQAVANGIGAWRRLHFRVIRSSGEVRFYDPTFEANLVLPNECMGRGIYLFDPRSLGLDEYLCLGYEFGGYLTWMIDPENLPKLSINRDTIGDEPCWRVKLGLEDRSRTLWIQDTNGFRLLKCYNEASFQTSSITSSYESTEQVLPSVVNAQRSDSKGAINSKMTLRIQKRELGVIVPPRTFTLENLGMPVGQFMADRRNNGLKSLGYWDGEQLVPELPVKAIAERRSAEVPRGDTYKPLIYASVLVFGVLGGYYLIRRVGR